MEIVRPKNGMQFNNSIGPIVKQKLSVAIHMLQGQKGLYYCFIIGKLLVEALG